ncbi:MAG: Holliday junction DNA helicase RuvA [Saprospiraceae bacterium]|jgi:Holliday junction DNA helicase RuvA
MIGYLRGHIIDKEPPWLVMDVNGVGYELEASMNTFYALEDLDDEVSLHVHMVVREDAQLLYGFISLSERALFRALLKVNGVGPRVALAILSTLSADEFAICVQNEDVAAIVKVPGIGKKTAERLIVEMRDRLPQTTGSSETGIGKPQSVSASSDAISALVALGYRSADASQVVRSLPDVNSLPRETIIRLALKSMSSK